MGSCCVEHEAYRGGICTAKQARVLEEGGGVERWSIDGNHYKKKKRQASANSINIP